jgi:Family of unknown function (DUF5681)
MSEPANAGRKQGRFVKGQSGNPEGKLRGTRHRATQLAETLLEGDSEALVRKAVELALGGDTVALKLCLDRILPPRRERTVALNLPNLRRPADNAEVSAAASLMITAQQRRHPHRQGLAAGALSG